MAHLPPGGLLEEGLLGQGHPLPLGQGEDDLLELGPVGDGVVDPHPEPGGEGELLLQGIGVVDVVLVLHVRPVLPGLPDEVAAVGGGVEEDVVRLGLHAPLDDRLEELVLHLVLLEGEVVDEDDEPVVPVLHQGDDGGQVLELMLVDLDHPQALVVVLVDEGLHAGGLAGARVAVEQGVVGGAAGQEGLGVLPKLLLLALVAHQVCQHHLVGVVNGQEGDPLRPGLHPEGLVQADHPHAVPAVVVGDQVEEGLVILGRRQGMAEGADLFAHRLVVPPLVLVDGGVVAEGGEAVDAQIGLDGAEVIVEQGPEDPEVAFGEVVHRPLQLPHPLGDEAEGVLIGHEEEGEVVLPQVAVKPVVGGQVQQPLDLVIEPPHQGLPGGAVALPLLKKLRQAAEDAVLP